MINLDETEKIKNRDSGNMIGSLQALGKQLKVAWDESRKVEVPADYKNVQNIVVSGMGGSALGPHFVRSVFDISLPVQIVNDCVLPSFVGEKTLVVVSSYSGATEETINSLKDAKKKSAKIIGVTSGGTLKENLKQASLPYYQFDTEYNPSGQPRMGLGYSIGGVLGLFSMLGFAKFSDRQMEQALKHLEEIGESFDLETAKNENQAKKTALALVGRIPIITAGPFLAGNAHIFANQINENAKTFADYFLLSEMSHHLLEGIANPADLGEKISFVFLDTLLYEKNIGLRVNITKEILSKADIESISYKIKAENKVDAAFEALVFSSWTSFYLAAANEIDPSPIPNVDYFKEQLKKLA
ncbi:MAG TPA: SIS domain-containing protein [Candidatus Nanoarchaeia archaeon]